MPIHPMHVFVQSVDAGGGGDSDDDGGGVFSGQRGPQSWQSPPKEHPVIKYPEPGPPSSQSASGNQGHEDCSKQTHKPGGGGGRGDGGGRAIGDGIGDGGDSHDGAGGVRG